jgi:hypothetical protein
VWLKPRRCRGKKIEKAYQAYSCGRQTLSDLSKSTGKSVRTLRRAFDRLELSFSPLPIPAEPVALTFDGTFFGRGCGLLIYRAQRRNIHWQEIENERLQDMEAGLLHLRAQAWTFSSVTIDGRKGAISLVNRLFPDTPVQLCIFHQKAIIRRYLTGHPKTLCGKELRALVAFLGFLSEEIFMGCLDDLRDRYADFLKERNELGQFKHRRLRSALRSLRSNAPFLFTHQRFPDRGIPTTTNSCDGSFAHWKNKVKIHRGLKKQRRAKMIKFLLSKT